MVPYDEIRASLMAAGIDYDAELVELDQNVHGSFMPRVRIEHRDNGKHRMYFDLGEGYLDTDNEIPIPDDTLKCVVFAFQSIRAMWQEGEQVPICSAIEGRPVVAEPQAECCAQCKESLVGKGRCKPKVRLFVLTEIDNEIKPAVINLSPTSIKHWSTHLRKLKRSGLPVVAVNTVFSLEDIRKNGYRWAEMSIGIDGIAKRETLQLARQIREECLELMTVVNERDFSDPGDKDTGHGSDLPF
jgi:hypothetical protein